MTECFNWRDHLAVHPAADLFPLMSESEQRELGEDIKARGLHHPIVLYQGKLLDGRNRLDAMELVGIKFGFLKDRNKKNKLFCLTAPTKSRIFGGEGKIIDHFDGDPYDYVLSANLRRRHLTGEQKRELIAKVLKAKPEASNVVIAKQTKTTDKTVAKVRRKLESTSEIPRLEKTTGADGKARKQRKENRAAERGKKTRAALTAQWIKDHPGQTADDFDRVSSCSASDAEAEEYGRWMAPFLEPLVRQQEEKSAEERKARRKERKAELENNRSGLIILAGQAADLANMFNASFQKNRAAITDEAITEVRRAAEAWQTLAARFQQAANTKDKAA
jgi:hypothetical protein